MGLFVVSVENSIMLGKLALLLHLVALCKCEILYEERFDDGDAWSTRWIQSTDKPDTLGKFVRTAGKFYGDKEEDAGIQTSQDARFYKLTAKIEKPFSNEGKQLVLQYTVKHEQNIDCGGGYIKLFPSTTDPKTMNGDTPYFIMFGPDICGPGTKKVHVIFNYKDKNHLIKKDIRCKDDELTHLYTLILNADNSYEVRIDGEKAESGKLEDDWDFLAPKKIPDPEAKKPADWVDEAKIPDPASEKPADWDAEPELIPDPEAKKPEDWDDEEDGEWEPAQINNPKFKGEWKPKMIDNPAYKGEWVHPEIDNPEYAADDSIYRYSDIGAIGFELWQVKSGTIFDNIIVADSVSDAEAHGKKYFEQTKAGEKKMKDEADAKEEEERKKREEEEKAKEKDKPKDEKDDADDEEEDDEEEKDEEPADEDAGTEDPAEGEEPVKDEL